MNICNKLFLNTRDRQLDHNHITGEIRNIVCCKCNLRRKDNKIRCDNNTGEDYINKHRNKQYKTGYCFRFRIRRDKKTIISTSRKTLEEAIIVRDKFIKNNPEIFT